MPQLLKLKALAHRLPLIALAAIAFAAFGCGSSGSSDRGVLEGAAGGAQGSAETADGSGGGDSESRFTEPVGSETPEEAIQTFITAYVNGEGDTACGQMETAFQQVAIGPGNPTCAGFLSQGQDPLNLFFGESDSARESGMEQIRAAVNDPSVSSPTAFDDEFITPIGFATEEENGGCFDPNSALELSDDSGDLLEVAYPCWTYVSADEAANGNYTLGTPDPTG